MVIVMMVVVVMERVVVLFLFSILETERNTNRGAFCLFFCLLFVCLWVFGGFFCFGKFLKFYGFSVEPVFPHSIQVFLEEGNSTALG